MSDGAVHEIAMEAQKTEQWKVENRRRKHNYVPFIVNLLKVLAERGELMPLVEAAKSRKKARSGRKDPQKGLKRRSSRDGDLRDG